MHILMTNDDGYEAPGLLALAKEIADLARITIVAPETGVSSCSGSLSLRKPILLKEQASPGDGITVYSLSGTTGDCCKIALEYLLQEDMPDLIVSGMNHGFNTGSDVLYSGTVAGAMESVFVSRPALAVSLERGDDGLFLKKAASFTADVIRQCFIEHRYEGILNLNIPYIREDRIKKDNLKVVPLGLQLYSNVVEVKAGTSGEKEFIMSGEPLPGEIPDTDVYWSRKGYITLTPLQWNQTDASAIDGVIKLVQDK